MRSLLVFLFVLVLATYVFAAQPKLYQMRDDFGTEPASDCFLQYYYYIPCPTYSWFWAYTGWQPGDIIGVWYRIGDQGTGGYAPCDPNRCHTLDQFRVLDFAGYGTTYPGLYTVEFNVYCLGDNQCPLMPALWSSGPYETKYGWNYVVVNPPLCLTPCYSNQSLRFLITAKMVGSDARYPAWGMDNISTPIEMGCQLHDVGCLAVTYPRLTSHSGYYGNNAFQYCPPLGFCDGRDQTEDCTQYGLIELAWRIYMTCAGPTAVEGTTWGRVKGIYR